MLGDCSIHRCFSKALAMELAQTTDVIVSNRSALNTSASTTEHFAVKSQGSIGDVDLDPELSCRLAFSKISCETVTMSEELRPEDSGPAEERLYPECDPALKKELDPKWSLDKSGPRELSFRMLAATEKFAQPPNADALRMRHLRTERINRVFSRNRSSGLSLENELRANLDRIPRTNLLQTARSWHALH